MQISSLCHVIVAAALIIICNCLHTSLAEIDPNGYILYCPCMGRFGNQAEQFLGTFQFAKALNRTLILPPFIEYVKYKINFIPFSDYINVERLQEYHRAILMDQFMTEIAPQIWKEDKRTIACYSARNFSPTKPPVEGCNPFEGSPFKEFWAHVGVSNFSAGSLYYSPLQTDRHFAKEWQEKFAQEPVLAFVGAPSSFPTNGKAVQLQQYVHFTDEIAQLSKEYRETRDFTRRPYISIHLRHGSDWSRACDLIKTSSDMKQLFSSQQCLGSKSDRFVDYDLCMPNQHQIVASIQTALSTYEARNPKAGRIEFLHIATDLDNVTLWHQLQRALPPGLTLITPSVTIHSDGRISRGFTEPHFMIDLYLMSHANVFVGNCISSFSAFVSRYRIYNLHFDQSTHFFAFDGPPVSVERYRHDEL